MRSFINLISTAAKSVGNPRKTFIDKFEIKTHHSSQFTAHFSCTLPPNRGRLQLGATFEKLRRHMANVYQIVAQPLGENVLNYFITAKIPLSPQMRTKRQRY